MTETRANTYVVLDTTLGLIFTSSPPVSFFSLFQFFFHFDTALHMPGRCESIIRVLLRPIFLPVVYEFTHIICIDKVKRDKGDLVGAVMMIDIAMLRLFTSRSTRCLGDMSRKSPW